MPSLSFYSVSFFLYCSCVWNESKGGSVYKHLISWKRAVLAEGRLDKKASHVLCGSEDRRCRFWLKKKLKWSWQLPWSSSLQRKFTWEKKTNKKLRDFGNRHPISLAFWPFPDLKRSNKTEEISNLLMWEEIGQGSMDFWEISDHFYCRAANRPHSLYVSLLFLW